MAQAVPIPPERERPIREKSTPELIREAVQDAGNLLQQEFQLFRLELYGILRQSFSASTMLIAGLMTVLFGVACLGATIILLLATVMAPWIAALIVTVVLLAAGAAVIYAGARSFSSIQFAPQTMETLKEDAEWLRHPTRQDKT